MVSSVNANQQAQYERKFSLGKTATSATFGAIGLKLANDAVLRKNAHNTLNNIRSQHILASDQFVTEATQNAKKLCEDASKTLSNTEYLTRIKEAVKNPTQIVDKVKNWAINVNVREIPANSKKAVTKAVEGFKTSAKSLKGETLSATLKNVLNATKTAKGRNVLTLATGALCGLMLFGTSKIVKKHDKNQA